MTRLLRRPGRAGDGSTRATGDAGERAARTYLKARGLRIVERNYRCALGELDLICEDAETIVFVEVKTRRSDGSADPEENITPAKQRKLELLASAWLAEHRHPDKAWRFDAISVVLPPNGPAQVRHIEEAFLPHCRQCG